MFGILQPGAAPTADDLDVGERVLSSLDDVRYVPSTIPGHIGRLTITDRHLRFRETRGAMREALHGFPSIGNAMSGGARVTVSRGEFRDVTTTRSLGVFSVLRLKLLDGRELAFHVGMRGLAEVVRALSPAAR